MRDVVQLCLAANIMSKWNHAFLSRSCLKMSDRLADLSESDIR